MAKPAKAGKRDLLKEMLEDVNAKLDAIGEMVADMQTHGDLRDDHVDLAKATKTLAKETHAQVKAIRKGE